MSVLLLSGGRVVGGSGGSAAWEANKPAGVTLFRSSTFGDLIEDTYNADDIAMNADTGFWNNTTDNSAPYGPSVTDVTYPEGSLGGNGCILYSVTPSPAHVKLYWCMSFALSSNYRAHGNEEKFFYPVVNTSGQPQQSTIVGLEVLGDETRDGTTVGWKVNTQIGGANTVFTQSTGNSHRVRKGQYQIIECFAQVNTPNTADGILKIWVDGGLAMDLSTVRFADYSTQSTFGGVRFTTTRGGGNDTGFPVPTGGQYRRYDRLTYYASTSF